MITDDPVRQRYHSHMNAQIEIVEKEIKGVTAYIVGDSVITFNRAEAEAMLSDASPIACELSRQVITNSPAPPVSITAMLDYLKKGYGLRKK